MTDVYFVKGKLDEFFWEWLTLPETQKIINKSLKGEGPILSESECCPSPHFRPRAAPGPSPPGSPNRTLQQKIGSPVAPDSTADGHWPATSPPSPPVSPTGEALAQRSRVPGTFGGLADGAAPVAGKLDFESSDADAGKAASGSPGVAAGTSNVIPRFWWPKRAQPVGTLSGETRKKMHDCFVEHGITEIKTHQQLEPVVTEVFGLSKYFVLPIFHKVKVFYDIVEASQKSKELLLEPSSVPITEQMLVGWANGNIQIDDPVLSFFWVVKSEHNQWIEREDFSIFINAILLTHPGLEFLQSTTEFQERYADTVMSRIFFVYDRKDVGRIYLSDLRRYKPSVIETWKQLADHDDIKMARDYFSYEHFYVIYCTFWELDADHDFLLDKDDLLKYDGYALSRRAIDRIFSEIPTKFTSGVPGRMGYEDFIRFLLCDQDRSTDRSVEYWFQLFDLDCDGCIGGHEMNYFYEEQLQRMECLNYETINFKDLMCQMNDMIFPRSEGQFQLSDFKRRRKFAGTFFSLFSSLNKLLNFEHRDPSQAKQEQLENPNFTEWDRWCADEYLRLAMEDGDDGDEDNTRKDDGFIDEVEAGKGH